MGGKLKLWITGALVSVATGVAFHKQQLSLVETFIFLFLGWILALCIELVYSKSASEDLLGELAPRLRNDHLALAQIRTLTKCALDAHDLKSEVINEHLTHVLRHARDRTAELADGTLEVDLLPAHHLRDFVDLCKHKYQGVSLVNLEEYWDGTAGVESFNKCRAAIKAGKTVQRIFIEHPSQFPVLARFVRQQHEAKIDCYVANYDKLDSNLRKDFAVIDDGEAVVSLAIDPDRTWTAANYYVNREGTSGHSKVREYVQTWHSLMGHAVPAEKFLQSYPPSVTLTATATPAHSSP